MSGPRLVLIEHTGRSEPLLGESLGMEQGAPAISPIIGEVFEEKEVLSEVFRVLVIVPGSKSQPLALQLPVQEQVEVRIYSDGQLSSKLWWEDHELICGLNLKYGPDLHDDLLPHVLVMERESFGHLCRFKAESEVV